MLSSCGRVLSFGELGSSDGHAIRCVGIDALLVCSRPSTSHYDGSLRLTHYFVRTTRLPVRPSSPTRIENTRPLAHLPAQLPTRPPARLPVCLPSRVRPPAHPPTRSHPPTNLHVHVRAHACQPDRQPAPARRDARTPTLYVHARTRMRHTARESLVIFQLIRIHTPAGGLETAVIAIIGVQ